MSAANERFAEACYRPFSNGTEGDAWREKWCHYCANDDGDGGCDLLMHSYMPDDIPWPEAWLPEPDDGDFALPSRLVCLAFKAHELGDPGAEDRAERIAEVKAYWREG